MFYIIQKAALDPKCELQLPWASGDANNSTVLEVP